MTDLSNPRPTLPERLARWSILAGGTALVAAAAGVVLARYDAIDKMSGLLAMLGAAVLAILGFFVALVALLLGRKSLGAMGKRAVLGLLLCGGYGGFMASRAMVASHYPAIHDITTDLADPPAFEHVKLRQDNLAGIGTPEAWRNAHARAYGDLLPVFIKRPVADIVADAEKLARERGWDIVYADPVSGRLEATASVSFIRYKDDVVVRVKRNPANSYSIVDMRSVSRIGQSDLGVNSKRIREFLAALSAK